MNEPETSAPPDRGFGFRGTARFEVRRCLGAGGMGVVYEAFDRERNARIALKTLRSLSADALLRFKREFRDFLDLAHPNLISLGELFSEGQDWFFTMELVDGIPFLEWVRPEVQVPPTDSVEAASLSPSATTLPDGPARVRRTEGVAPLDEPRLRAALVQLTSGLQALHAADKVHRDIKPSNVLVTPAGRVVLLDFGLATELSRQEQLSSTDVVGTVEYMAPEQAAARPVGPSADWYAVGVMLYEALTGELPFSGPALEVLMNKQRLEPVAPRTVDADAPPDLERLCLDLLRFEPAERPSGAEILRRLGVRPSETRPSRPSVTQAPLFVGRAAELADLRAAFALASGDGDGQRQAVQVHVHGESGVGKSALVRRFAEVLKLEEPEVVILDGHCYERESVPYKAVDGLVDAISRYLVRLPKADAASILPRQAALLTSVFPVLSRVEPFAEAPRLSEVRDPLELRSRLFGAVRELFGRLAERKLLVLTIDDLQWADADSLALLAEVTRPPEAPPLLLVATVRDRPADSSGLTIMATSLLQGEVRRLHLSRMPSEEAERLAQLLIARAAGRPDLDPRAVAQEAGGHPLFIDELIRHSGAGGTPGMHLEEALWARIQQLDPAARGVLEVAALAGGRLVQKTAAHAAALDAAEFSKLVGMLRVAHLVRTSGTRGTDFIEPYHDRVRAAVLAHLPEVRARAQHRRMALALEAAEHADPEALARHWRDAGERARGAEYAAQAAEKAARALAFDRAAGLYGECLLLGLARDRKGRDLRVKRAHALVNAGRGTEAAALFAEAAADASPTEALDLRRRAAEQLLRSGHVAAGLEALRTVLGAVGMELAETPARALSSLLWRRARLRVRGLAFKERSEGQLPAETLTRIDTCWSVAAGLSMVDLIRSADFQARHLLLALDAGEPYRVARALAMEAGHVATAGKKAEARAKRLVAAATELAQRIGHPHAIGMAELAHGVAAYQTGRWAEALARCQLADRLFREGCVGVAWEIVTAQLFRLNALYYVGELARLQREAAAALKEVEERGDLYASTTLRIRPMHFAALAADDVAGARARADEAMRQWTPRVFHAQHYYHMVALAHADLYAGDGAAAWQRLTSEWRALQGSLFLRVQVVRVEALSLRGRAALAAAVAMEPRSASPLLRVALESADALDREALPWAHALGLLLRAGVTRLLRTDAVAPLVDEAARLFVAEDMQLHAWVARRAVDREAADRWLAAQQVRSPGRMAAMLAPGLFDPREG
jgi:hypothetical protein